MNNIMHSITKIDDDKVYFVCSGAPRLEMMTYDAPKKCPICSCIRPISLDGTTEVREIEPSYMLRKYDDSSMLSMLVSTGESFS